MDLGSPRICSFMTLAIREYHGRCPMALWDFYLSGEMARDSWSTILLAYQNFVGPRPSSKPRKNKIPYPRIDGFTKAIIVGTRIDARTG